MRMRFAHAGLLLVLLFFGPWGCHCDDEDRCCGPDTDPPAAPRGLYSITGDDEVTLVWLANTEDDLDGYYLWWSDSYDGSYEYFATVYATHHDEERYVDEEAHNGGTYYYAVTAFDRAGNESELSYDEVWDTPRPEGRAELGNAYDYPLTSGFDFSNQSVVAKDSHSMDFYYDLAVWDEEFLVPTLYADWIQDMGWTADFDEISFAPDDIGWSETGAVEALVGHTYVLLTLGGSQVYYAKIRVTLVTNDHVKFQWAFQEVPNNLQLSVPGAP